MESVLKKVGGAILAASLASTMMAGAAFATSSADAYKPTEEASTEATGSYVTGAATRAASPSIEILGLAGVEESGQFVNTTTWYDWTKPKYTLLATKRAGDDTFSPYLTNLANSYGTTAQRAVLNSAGRSGSGAGPNQALGSSTNDTTIAGMAQVVVGDGGVEGSSAIGYDASYYSTLADTMDDIASAANSAATTAKPLRYGSATDIADQYREYIYGTMGAIQQRINATGSNHVDRKTVALVQDIATVEDSSGEEVDGFDLMTTGEAKSKDGTALVNRYLETVLNYDVKNVTLAVNFADDNDGEATIADLESDDVDLILVGGQQSSSNYASIIARIAANPTLLAKTYFVENNGSNGSMYGVTMNSVENAQNIGRILGCLYPEVVNQQSWIAYYYQNFYHIQSAYLADTIDGAMDGVRCWAVSAPSTVNEAKDWTVNSATDANGDGYNDSFPSTTVASTISNGYSYYQYLQNLQSQS